MAKHKTSSQSVVELLVALVALGVIVSQAAKANTSDPLIIGAALAMLGLVPANRMDDIRNRLNMKNKQRGVDRVNRVEREPEDL